jgi:hypothetical protein
VDGAQMRWGVLEVRAMALPRQPGRRNARPPADAKGTRRL